MMYLTVIETFTDYEIKECETEAAARLWKDEKLEGLRKEYQLHNWDSKWVIYPFLKAIRYNKEKNDRQPSRISRR